MHTLPLWKWLPLARIYNREEIQINQCDHTVHLMKHLCSYYNPYVVWNANTSTNSTNSSLSCVVLCVYGLPEAISVSTCTSDIAWFSNLVCAWFLKVVFTWEAYMNVCVCARARARTYTHTCMLNTSSYSYSCHLSAFIDRYGLSNSAHNECLSKKAKDCCVSCSYHRKNRCNSNTYVHQ